VKNLISIKKDLSSFTAKLDSKGKISVPALVRKSMGLEDCFLRVSLEKDKYKDKEIGVWLK